MRLGREFLYLSSADVEACGLGPDTVEATVEAMFAAKAAGWTVMKPKLCLHASSATLFLASAGVLDTPAYGGVKWLGIAGNDQRNLPHIAGLVLLNDV